MCYSPVYIVRNFKYVKGRKISIVRISCLYCFENITTLDRGSSNSRSWVYSKYHSIYWAKGVTILSNRFTFICLYLMALSMVESRESLKSSRCSSLDFSGSMKVVANSSTKVAFFFISSASGRSWRAFVPESATHLKNRLKKVIGKVRTAEKHWWQFTCTFTASWQTPWS